MYIITYFEKVNSKVKYFNPGLNRLERHSELESPDRPHLPLGTLSEPQTGAHCFHRF